MLSNSDSDSAYPPPVKTLGRANEVLRLFLEGGSSLSLASITDALGWSKATAFRFCRGLEQLGLLERDENGRFSLGPMALDLGTAYMAGHPVRSRVSEVVESLSRRTHATTLVCSLVAGEVLTILTAENDAPIRAAARIGERMPVHATAAGKAIAADLSADELEALLEDLRFRKYTARTIGSKQRFRRELKAVRQAGYSTALDEYHEGVFSVALSLDRRLLGRPSAMVVVRPSNLAPMKDHNDLVDALQAARFSLDPLETRQPIKSRLTGESGGG